MKYVLLVVIATVVSAQVLMLAERRRPIAARLRDLGDGGDAFLLGGVALLMCGSLGALIGHLLGSPGAGATAGIGTALAALVAGIAWAHKRPHPPARHSEPPDSRG